MHWVCLEEFLKFRTNLAPRFRATKLVLMVNMMVFVNFDDVMVDSGLEVADKSCSDFLGLFRMRAQRAF